MPGRRATGTAAIAVAIAMAARARHSLAQAMPDGPVTVVVPYTPGTGHDILARLLAPHLQQRLSHAVAVDNRAGASGNIGSQAVVRARPDGRTLLLQGNAFVINPSLFRQVPYDPIGDFTPIVQLVTADLVLSVHPDIKADTAQAFADLARARPGALDYASPGIGTPQHMAMALLSVRAGLELTHVPYRGSAPAVQDLIGRRVAAMFLPVHTAMPLARDGQIRLLALGGAQRSPVAPTVPTLGEAGFPNAEVNLWYGILGPAGMNPDLVRRLNEMVNAWLALPETADALRNQGMVAVGGAPDAFARVIAADVARWAAVVREARISAD